MTRARLMEMSGHQFVDGQLWRLVFKPLPFTERHRVEEFVWTFSGEGAALFRLGDDYNMGDVQSIHERHPSPVRLPRH